MRRCERGPAPQRLRLQDNRTEGSLQQFQDRDARLHGRNTDAGCAHDSPRGGGMPEARAARATDSAARRACGGARRSVGRAIAADRRRTKRLAVRLIGAIRALARTFFRKPSHDRRSKALMTESVATAVATGTDFEWVGRSMSRSAGSTPTHLIATGVSHGK